MLSDSNENSEQHIRTKAASKIQRIWRRYIDLQVSKYYKDLVTFHNTGDPVLIMKYINPIEAKLIDSASGIHIKFRLAGHQFPPTIYYKIFTHRPIQDICANAPRDYTKPYLKFRTAEMNNNRNKKLPIESLDGWYKRIENNGWRPVSNKNLHQMNLDYFYGEFNHKTKAANVFLHSKIARKQEVELKRKKTKIEWMKKMYKLGMLKSKENDTESNIIIEDTAKNILSAYEMKDINSVDEWEVDQLLDWTQTLSYDEYLHSWKSIGTTAVSEKLVVERFKIKNNNRFEREETFDTQSPDFSSSRPLIGSSSPLHSSTHRN